MTGLKKNKTLFLCLSKINKQQEITTFLRLRGYRILQQPIGLCISLFSDINIILRNSFSGYFNRANKEIHPY